MKKSSVIFYFVIRGIRAAKHRAVSITAKNKDRTKSDNRTEQNRTTGPDGRYERKLNILNKSTILILFPAALSDKNKSY